MTPFHSTSKADFCVLKIPCVLKIFSKPRPHKNSHATGLGRSFPYERVQNRSLRKWLRTGFEESLQPSDPTSPISSFTGHWGGTLTLDHGRVAAKPTIGAWQCQLCLSSPSSLSAICSAKDPASNAHHTLAGTTLPSHFSPDHTAAPHSHFCFGYK